MTNTGQSDTSIVAVKSANNAGGAPAAESMEPRGVPKGNVRPDPRLRAQHRAGLQEALAHIWQAAQDKDLRFTTLWHHVYALDRLRETFYRLRKDGAPGVDTVTWQAYAEDLETHLQDLSDRLRRGAYHALPVRRVYIPKPDGRPRPLGIPALEDKLVQRATADVLQAVYEGDFHDFSYGFRPGRNPHQALDALVLSLQREKVNYVLDVDIRAFFDSIDHAWLLRFLEQRIADTRVLRHIKKWLNAGVLEEGQVQRTEQGTPQGGSISPLLANIYLHYVFDAWAVLWGRQHAYGVMKVLRFADDVVVCFQHRVEAEQFLRALQARLAEYHLELHPEKTRLVEFGRFAASNRQRRGEGKPETFTFLGLTHICSQSPEGYFQVLRKTIRTRMLAKLHAIKQELRRRMHDGVEITGKWLRRVVQGYYQYYALAGNLPMLYWFRDQVTRLWKRRLARRSQKGYVSWAIMHPLAERWLPRPTCLHPYPGNRQPI